jgi:anti-anti-sigma factor
MNASRTPSGAKERTARNRHPRTAHAARPMPPSVLRAAAEVTSVKISIRGGGSRDRMAGHAARTAGYAMKHVSVDSGEITNAFTVRLSRDGSSAWLAIAGELDFDGVRCLRGKMAELAGIRPAPDMIRVDLTGLTFVDAAGARALVAGCQRIQQQCRWFEAWGVHPRVERVLGLIGIPLPGRRASWPSACPVGLALRPLAWPAGGTGR